MISIKKLLKNKMVKNAGWLIAGKIIQMIISLFVGLLTARYLGPSNYGIINYAGAYTAFFASLSTLGINSVLVKELIDNPEKEGTVLGTSLLLRAVSSFLSALTIVGIVSFLDADEPVTILVVFLSSLGMLFQIFELFNYWFQSKLQSKITAIAILVAYIVTALYRIFLLIFEKSVVFFALASSVDYIVLALILFWVYKKSGGGKLKFSWAYGKSILKKSVPFILTGLMVSIYGQTDKLMLKQMINSTEVGYYATAVSICNMWCFVLSAIIDSMYPTIMQAWNKNKDEFDQKNKILYAIVFYVSICVSFFFTLFAELIVFVLYGEAFLPTALPLKIITWYTAFSYLGVARDAWIVCQNKQKYLIYVYVSAAIVNVILNLLFIPLWGSAGAAWASLVAQIVTVMVVPFFIKPLRENSKLMLEAIALKGLIHRKK